MPIINCHIHTFTQKNVPKKYLGFITWVMRKKAVRSFLLWFSEKVFFMKRDWLERYANFAAIANKESQEEVFLEVRHRYPLDTKFIVLPMDLRGIHESKIENGIRNQHEELEELTQKYPNQIIPFIHIDPRSFSVFQGTNTIQFIEEFHQRGFKGIKLYPPLGYSAIHKDVMPIYEYANTHNLPVMTHCSTGGVHAQHFKKEDIHSTTAPHLYQKVIHDHPNLKLCLAHFGGNEEWDKYLREPWKDDHTPIENMNWLSQITTMIKSENYPNLYTDISYTIFRFDRFIPILKVFLEDPVLKERILFGSDYYMIEQEKLTEREISMKLRGTLGREMFEQIAVTNPQRYLS